MCVHIDPFEPDDSPLCSECLKPKKSKKRPAVKPAVTLDDLGAVVDPFDVHIEEILAGKRCARCSTVRDHHNRCLCEREADFLAITAEVDDWFAEVDRDIAPDAGAMAYGAMRRAHLKLGADTPSATPGVSFAQFDMQASRARYFGPAKLGSFRKPQVNDPSELPV